MNQIYLLQFAITAVILSAAQPALHFKTEYEILDTVDELGKEAFKNSPRKIHAPLRSNFKDWTDENEKNAGRHYRFPFQDPSLSWEDRVNDLVSRLTLDELQLQMARGGAWNYGGPAPGIPRLGIGPYVWNTNCHRGDQQVAENATAFPQSIGLVASFSPQVLHDVGIVSSIETRGKHNDFVRRGIFATHTGASCFSPVINVVRDSRWGRTQETYGEDPYMSGEMAAHFLHALHGDHPRFVRVTGGCLHVDAYSGPENVPTKRFNFNANVSDEDLHMTYLPGFKRCVTAGTYSFMCSYNSINGVPACANKRILTDIMRTDWKFKGYVISDQGAIERLITAHKYYDNFVDAAAGGVNAGVNLELSENLPQPVYLSILDALNQGKVNQSQLRELVKPLFYTRMRLGEFDPPETNPFSKLNRSVTETPEHQAKAIEVAMKSFVLLKNKNDLLPLRTDIEKVAIIGPMCDEYDQIFGNLPPIQDRSFTKTPLQGLRELYPHASYSAVCSSKTWCRAYNHTAVKNLVKDKDLILAVFGTGPLVEKEGRDRKDLSMPGRQKELLEDIIKLRGNARIVLLLLNAAPLNVTFVDESDDVEAILECFFPGQATGEAIKNVLINKGGNSSPAGRLPTTWPKYDWQLPPMVNYSMVNRTYRYLETPPLYPFGYGLSYSRFFYAKLKLMHHNVGPRENLTGSFEVTNTGRFDADEVFQCYISWMQKSLPVPFRQLAYFNRVHIKVGQALEHSFSIGSERWAFWQNGQWNVKAGEMSLYCGGQQPNQEKHASSNVLMTSFYITSSATFPDSL